MALHGDLPLAAQDAAIRPAAAGRRKIVLATSIAETSLTIEGIRIVVDSGLVRAPRFDPNTGMGRLETLRVSRAAAEQRAGRAGRVEPGTCFRLWSAAEHRALAAFAAPEIREADLAGLALEIARWGGRDPSALRWPEPPPPPMLAQAREVLRDLGALDAEHAITARGREMAELGLHPRLAHMLLEGRRRGAGPLARALARQIGERAPQRSGGPGAPRAAGLRRGEALRGADG